MSDAKGLLSRYPLLVGLLLATVLAFLDVVVARSVVLVGLLGVAPLVAGLRAGVRPTAAVAIYALRLPLVLGFPDEIFGTADHLTRLLVVTVSGGVAIRMALLRERALAASRQARSVFQSALDCIVTIDGTGTIIDLNPSAESTFGYARNRAIGRQLCGLIIPERFREAHNQGLERMRRGDASRLLDTRVELPAIRADGEEFPVELTVTKSSVEPLLFTGFLRDITEAKRIGDRAAFLGEAGSLLETSIDYEETLSQIARLAVPGLADWAFVEICQPDGSIKRLAMAHSDPEKEALVRELDRRYPIDPDASEGSAKVIRTGQPELTRTIPDEMLEQVAEDPDHLRILRDLSLKSALVVPLRARGRVLGDLALVYAESGRCYDEFDLATAQELAVRCALAIDNARLFEESRHSEALLREQALRDPLTGLANRTLLIDRLGLALARTGRREGEPALLFFDLDGFKAVNDDLGHHAGDQLLIAVAERVKNLLRAEDTISRFGGDEFAILCEDVVDVDRATLIANRLVTELRTPFEIDAGTVRLGASLGLVFARGPEETPESMLRNADAAMYQAKRIGKAGYQVFVPSPPALGGAA